MLKAVQYLHYVQPHNHYTVCKDSAASLTTHAESHNTTKVLTLNVIADEFHGPEF